MNHSRLYYRLPYKDNDTDDLPFPGNTNFDFEEIEDEGKKEPQAESSK